MKPAELDEKKKLLEAVLIGAVTELAASAKVQCDRLSAAQSLQFSKAALNLARAYREMVGSNSP